jgi:hypothetical protein
VAVFLIKGESISKHVWIVFKNNFIPKHKMA